MQTTQCFDMSPLLHAAAAHAGRPMTGDVRWLHGESDELERLTDADRELILVLTGEILPDDIPEGGLLVSFLVMQLALDRAIGALPMDEHVSITYVEAVFDAYERCPDGNPMSEDLFDFALAFLVGRDLARLGPDVVHFG